MALKNLKRIALLIIPVVIVVSVVLIFYIPSIQQSSKSTIPATTSCPTNVIAPLKHGVFIFNKNECAWESVKVEKYWVPEKDGIYLLVFMQEWCGACHMYEPIFNKYVLDHVSSEITFVTICLGKGWKPGDSIEKTFYKWNIRYTPTTIIVEVENGKTSRISIFEGVMSYERLDNFIKKFLESG
ncbi:MAG: hypothetical protein DRO15_02995 [Thermoprotei archaeon]|nr:MAG: hypothetical protein DRO15_02995 [Thermoprotei archaeon]